MRRESVQGLSEVQGSGGGLGKFLLNGIFQPFEVKYRAQHTGLRDLKGLLELCRQKAIDRGYVVTKSLDDFGTIDVDSGDPSGTATRILRIPAPLLCYWMGESELASEQL